MVVPFCCGKQTMTQSYFNWCDSIFYMKLCRIFELVDTWIYSIAVNGQSNHYSNASRPFAKYHIQKKKHAHNFFSFSFPHSHSKQLNDIKCQKNNIRHRWILKNNRKIEKKVAISFCLLSGRSTTGFQRINWFELIWNILSLLSFCFCVWNALTFEVVVSIWACCWNAI